MAAKTQKQRDEKVKAKREELDEKELRHRCRLGTRQRLGELMAWNEVDEQSEAIQALIWNAHALGPEGSRALLTMPRHVIEVSENVARDLYALGMREAARLDKAEQ